MVTPLPVSTMIASKQKQHPCLIKPTIILVKQSEVVIQATTRQQHSNDQATEACGKLALETNCLYWAHFLKAAKCDYPIITVILSEQSSRFTANVKVCAKWNEIVLGRSIKADNTLTLQKSWALIRQQTYTHYLLHSARCSLIAQQSCS